MKNFHSYRPSEGHRLAHDPLNAIVAPRPIGWISSVSAEGVRNLAPYSFFNLFNYKPPIIGFCSQGEKDSLNNIRATGEFVWNLVSHDLAAAMNASSAGVPAEVDEFALSGLASLASRAVAPPRVAESFVQFECHLSQIVQLTRADGAPLPAWLVLGEVVWIHIDPRAIVEGSYDTAAANPVLRGGGQDYFTLGTRFQAKRPG